MASFNTVTLTLTNTSAVTITVSSADYPDAATVVQNIVRGGGVFDNSGQAFYPIQNILMMRVS